MKADDCLLRERFDNAGQGQVFEHFDQLNDTERAQLIEQASQIDLDELNRLYQTLIVSGGEAGIDLESVEPAPFTPLPRNGGDLAQWRAMKQLGEAALADGRVAAFTVAGGQGTRLGYDGPKGTFPVTPVRHATLFQVFAEKIGKAAARFGCPVPWFIMTSTINHEATKAFFIKHDWFGLGAHNVHLFRQGLMPAVDSNGKILLSERGSIAMSPDGHGGSLRALVRSGSVARMEELGVDVISYFQVDNPLVKCIDPAFIGFHIDSGSEMSSKMLPKAFPKEKVGNFCRSGENLCVIEYSDLPDELAEKKNDTGSLAFLAGSIAIHVLDREFVRRLGGDDAELQLPFHRAHKKVPVYSAETGCSSTPDEPNGYKFEMFVFDALPFARSPIIIETAREDDFSPVKNAEGIDSPETCEKDQLREYARWLRAAGVDLETDATGLPAFKFEITPAFADTEDAFVQAWKALDPKPEISSGTILF